MQKTNPAPVQVHGGGPSKLNGKSPPDWRVLHRTLQELSGVEVSVVVPNRDYGKLLPHCLRSVVKSAQWSGLSYEVLMVDDGSTDNSVDIACRAGVNVVMLHEPSSTHHYGMGIVRNVGVSLARGAYVIFADSDDVVDREYVATYINTLRKFDVEHVTGGHVRFYPPPRADKRPPKVYPPTERLGSIAAYPRAVLLALGGWSTIARLEDVEFNERFDAAGFRHARVEQPLYWWRRYESTARLFYHNDDDHWRNQIARGREDGGIYPIARPPLLDANGLPLSSVGSVLNACGAQLRRIGQPHTVVEAATAGV